MLPIAKRCDHYLRTLLVQGARSSMRYLDRRRDPPGVWANRLRAKRGSYIAAVAIANKNARVIWAQLTRGESYRETPARRPQVRIAHEARAAAEGTAPRLSARRKQCLTSDPS